MTKTHNANRLAAQLKTAIFLTLPVHIFHFCIRPIQVVCQRQKHPQSMFCHGISIAFGRSQYRNAPFGGVNTVDYFYARPDSTHKTQPRPRLQQGFIGIYF